MKLRSLLALANALFCAPALAQTNPGLTFPGAAGNVSCYSSVTGLTQLCTGITVNSSPSSTFGSNQAWNSFTISDTALLGSNFSIGTQITHIFGGASVTGGRAAFQASIANSAATSASNPNRNYVGITGIATAGASDGGGLGTEKGAFFGANFVATAVSGATHLSQLTGGEVNILAPTGTSMTYKAGWTIVQSPTDAVQGSTVDAGLVFSNQAGAVGWNDAILLSNPNGQFPLTATGNVLRTSGGTFKIGIDFNSSTMTATLRSPNATGISWRNAANSADVTALLVDGSNNIEIGSNNFSGTIFVFGTIAPNANNVYDLGAGGASEAFRNAYLYGIQAQGSSSGQQLWKPAAVASGTITLPAGTVDFSATGGASQVVKQTSSGGIFTVARLACADLSDSSSGCSAASGITALTGDVTATGPGSVAATLATVASAGTTGSSTAIPVITINAKGLTTSITTAAVVAPAGTLTGATLAAGVTASSLTSLGTIASLTATTINAFTLGGTVAGGGNQINNIVIGTVTPLAGNFTAVTDTSEVITGGTLASGANVLAISATQSATNAIQTGVNINITSAGTDTNNHVAIQASLGAGFTGIGNTAALSAGNGASGTGVTLIPAANSNAQVVNAGGLYPTTGAGAGYNVGVVGKASASTALNAGALFLSQVTSNGAANFGIVASAINGGTGTISQVAGYFTLNGAAPTNATPSAVIIADNGSNTNCSSAACPIALFQVSGSTKSQVTSAGNFSAPAYISSGTVPIGNTGACVASSVTGGATAGAFSAATCAGTTLTLSSMPAAPNGYACVAIDRTTTTNTVQQISTNTTSVSFKATTTNADVVQYSCTAY